MVELLADPLDNLVLGLDRALQTLTGGYTAERPCPGTELTDQKMEESERKHAAGLMRVNHTGEVCAQALYEGQALTAKSEAARTALLSAAQEERDHLSWCRQRLSELDDRTSVLDPIFYGASFFMGALTGLAGDKVSLGFVEATEDQVVSHLDGHMDDLPVSDHKSRAIVAEMRADESRHGAEALANGGERFPEVLKRAMTLISKVMTQTTYRV